MIRITFYIIFLCLFTQFLNAQQNLVYNGDFELFDFCPTGPSSVGDYQIEHCLGWNSPSNATPDYLNSCNTGISVGVPYNLGGYQYPHNGNGYVGIIAFNYLGYWYFEYVQGKLISNLEAGTKYHLSFKISCGEGYSNIGISKIGVFLEQNQISNPNYLPLSNPAVYVNNDPIIDTIGWQEISTDFFANGNEKFISIGYVGDTNYLDTVHLKNIPFQNYPVAYYYIDDVKIVKSENQCFSNVFTPNGDDINDYIDFESSINLNNNVFVINRWGNVVYSSEKDGGKWNGNNCSEGVYFYKIQSSNNENVKSGYIQLIR